MPWFFSYGLSTDVEQMRADVGHWRRHQAATLGDHVYTFTGYHPAFGGATSTLLAMPGGQVLGVAYEIDADQLHALVESGHGYRLAEHRARLSGSEVSLFTLEPPEIGPLGAPSAAYLGRVRAGLGQHYPAPVVDLYLKRALARATERPVPRQPPRPGASRHEGGVDMRRLFPWTVTNTAPFGSAWIVVRPGERTEPHCHDEEETFIFVRGQGAMSVDGREFPVGPGDVVYLDPFAAHTVKPSGEEPVEFLCIWWNALLPTTVTRVTEDGSLQRTEAAR